jgi:hypothetical protein
MQRGITTLCVVIGVLAIVVYVAAAAPDCAVRRCVYVPLIAAVGPTVTPTPLPTDTPVPPTRTPTATPNPVTLFTNGDFEQGAVFWQPQANADAIITTSPGAPVIPHSGTHVARLTAVQDASLSAIDAVNVVVPAGTPYLSYWVWIRSTEATCGDDLGGVGISVGPASVDSFNLCTATQTNGWVNRILNLSTRAGETVTIEFLAGTFDTNTPDSILYIDDIGWRANP